MSVLVVAEDALARRMLAGALEAAGLEVTRAVAAAPRARGEQTLLWDVGAEDGEGLEALAAAAPLELPAVALVSGPAAARAAWSAGARGLLLRDGEPGRIAAALRTVHAGLAAGDEALLGAMLQAAEARAGRVQDKLTAREQQVLEHLARGSSNKQIAAALGVSEHTAKFHASSILAKLGAESRTEAVVRAAQLGWLLL